MNRIAGGPGHWRRHLTRFLAASLVAFLHYAPQIASFQAVRNRYFRPWERADLPAFLLAPLLLGLAATAIAAVADRPRFAFMRRPLAVAFLVVFVAGVLANIPRLSDRVTLDADLAWLLLAGLAGWTLARPRPALPRIAFGLSLVLSPLVAIAGIQMATWTPWGRPPDPIRFAARADSSATPVFMFIFDEWAWDRSTADGAFREDLPHLRALAARSILFRAAQSPATETYTSVPQLLYGRGPSAALPSVFVRDERHEYITPEDRDRPDSARAGGLLGLARAAGLATGVVGFYLPYRAMLDGEADVIRGYSDYPVARDFGGRLAIHALENLRYETGPVSRRLFRPLMARVFSRHWARLNATMEADVLESIAALPARGALFVHFPAPHAPFVIDPRGHIRGSHPVRWREARDDDEDRMLGSVADYERALLNLDRLVGRFMAALEERGLFDRALVVVTSDHGWRLDPDPARREAGKLHVPLLVKLPGEQQPLVVDEPIENIRWIGFAELVLAGHTADSTVAAVAASVR